MFQTSTARRAVSRSACWHGPCCQLLVDCVVDPGFEVLTRTKLMALSPFCIFSRGEGPIVSAAVHHGHDTRPEVERRMAISAQARMREEDPFTGSFAQAAQTQIVGLRSRFEVDLNRPRDEAVYETPADAWGLEVWEDEPTDAMIRRSLEIYDQFYTEVHELLTERVEQHGHVVVLDLHTYNYRRNGPNEKPSPAQQNPEVNIGTGTMDRKRWSGIVDQFIADLSGYEADGEKLDVRENVKFQGGHFGRWIHETFPKTVCAIAIEFKKSFMDEWTGEEDIEDVERIYDALRSTLPGLRAQLEQMKH